jgi:hypothetical protein
MNIKQNENHANKIKNDEGEVIIVMAKAKSLSKYQ